MKKSLVLIVAMLVCVVSVVSVTAFTSEESDAATFSGDFVYEDTVLTLTSESMVSMSGISSIITADMKANATRVVITGFNNVEDSAFKGFVSLKVVELNDVQIIGSNAFEGCKSLTTLYGENVRTILNNTFLDCKAIKKVSDLKGEDVITLPSCEVVGTGTFYRCDALEEVSLSKLKTVGDNFVRECKNLKICELLSVDYISGWMFYLDAAVERLILPSATTVNPNCYFSSMKTLTYVDLRSLTGSIPNSSFSSNNSILRIYSYDGRGDVKGDMILGTAGSGAITELSNSLFSTCKGLIEVYLPDVTIVGESCFSSCSSLKEVTLSTSGCQLKSSAFSNCSVLQSVVVKVSSLDANTGGTGNNFVNCISLTTIGTKDNVIDLEGINNIYNGAFQGCKSIKSVVVGSEGTTTYFGTSAFEQSGITSFTTEGSVTFSRNSGTSSNNSFYACYTLETFKCDEIIGDIGINLFNGDTKLNLDFNGFKGVTSVGNSAFASSGLSGSIDLSGVKAVGTSAFSNTKIISIILGSKDSSEVAQLGYQAFQNCYSLKNVNFISDVELLGSTSSSLDYLPVTNTFNGCSSLEAITFEGDNKFVNNLGGNTFYGCSKLVTIQNGDGESEVFSEVTGLGSYCFNNCTLLGNNVSEYNFDKVDTIDSYAFNNVNSMKKVVFENKVKLNYRAFYVTSFTIIEFKSGVGIRDDRNASPLYETFRGSVNLSKVLIEESDLDSIYSYMFYGCSSLKDVGPSGTSGISLSSVKSIGDYAFYNCSMVKTVSCSKLLSVGSHAFDGCTNLVSVNPNDNYDVTVALSEIQDYAFYRCDNLKSIFSEVKILKIGDYSFGSSKLLNTVTDTSGKRGIHLFNVKTIGNYSFVNCPSLETVNMGGSLSRIGNYAFQNCYFLSDLYLSYSLETIGDYSFYNCYSIKSLVLPQNLSYIGKQAFAYCNGLIDVVIPNSVVNVGDQAFLATTNGGSGTMYICTDSKNITYGKEFVKFTGSRSWTVYSTAADGTKINSNMNIEKCSYVNRSLITVTLNGDFGIYSSPKVVAMDGCKVILPYRILGSEIESKNFGIAVNSSSNGLLVGSSGEMVTLYSGPSGDYTLFTTGSYSEYTTIHISGGDLNGIRFEYDNVSHPVSMDLTVRYGDVITMPMAYLSGYEFNRYTGAVTGDSLSLKPGQETRIVFYETSFIVGSVPRLFTLTISVEGNETILDVKSGDRVMDSITNSRIPTVIAGYEFAGWLESSGDLKSKIDDNYLMPAHNLTLYAGFTPSDLHITVSSDIGLFETIIVTVKGPFSISVDSIGRLLVTDKGDNSKTPQVNPEGLVKGKEYGYYSVISPNTHGISFDDAGSLKSVDDRPYDLELHLVLSNSIYSVSFDYGGLTPTVPAEYKKESQGDDLLWSDILSGIIVSVPSLDGYVLSGVTVGSGKLEVVDGTVTLTKDHFAIDDDVTVSFSFEQGRYIVKFNYNDDEKHTSLRTGTVKEGDGSKISFKSSPYSKEGYTFSGWKAGEFEITAAQMSKNPVVDFTSDVLASIGEVEDMTIVFEGQWEPIIYDIKMELNVGEFEGDVPVIEWVMGEKLTGLVEPVRKGYVFQGWALVARTTGAYSYIFVENGDILTREILSGFSEGVTITIEAVWTNAQYTMVFDNNGASGGSNISPIVRYFGQEFEAPGHNTNSKANHTYEGWVIVGDSRTFNDGDTITVDETLATIGDQNGGYITFKMNWVSTDYYVTYNLNGGHGVTLSNSGPYNIGDSFTPESPSGLVRSGYSFAGWALTLDAVVPYAFGGGFDTNMAFYAESSASKTVTLYAVWSQLQYNIQYDLQSGVSGSQSPVKAFYGKVVSISNPSKVGYKFMGWTATGLTDDAQYVSGDGFVVWNDGTVPADSTEFKNLSFQQNGVVVLTANWAKATYRVQYDLNGGVGTINGGSTTGSVGDPFSFPTVSGASYIGHEFSGWSTDGIAVLKESTFTSAMAARADENGVVTLKAVWTPISYNVEFRYMEGDTYTSTKGYFGVSLQIGEPERVGYEFVGWTSTDVKSPEALYSPDGVVWYSWPTGSDPADGCYLMSLCAVKNGTVHLTASWKAVDYRIAYSANGGAGTPPTDLKTYKVGDPLELAPITDLEGTWGNKIILGWSTDQTATVPMSLDTFVEGMAEKANLANIVTLYAVWIEGSYVVTVDIGDSKPSMVPSGWEINDDGKYQRDVEYGASVKEIMAEWDNVVLELDGQVFKSWKYSIGTVLTNVEVVAEFEAVSMEIMYILAVGIVAVAAVAFVFTRFERW